MKRYIEFIIIFTLAYSLSGCSNQVATHDEAVKSIKTSSKKEIIPETWSAADSSDVVDDGWLKSFNDPTLLELVDEAQENNFGLKIISARVDQAEALAKQAGSGLKPTIGLSGGYLDPTNDRLGELYGGGVKISWEADVWGRIRSAATGAEEAAAASRSDYEFARQSLAAATANSWFIAITSKILSDQANEVVSLLEETLRIIEVKTKVGQTSMRDVHLARANLAKAEEAARDALSSFENSKRSLEVLLGRYPAADINTINKLPANPPPIAAGMPSQLLERRPDLIAAEQRVAVAFYKQKSAEVLNLPRFNFSAGLGISNLRSAASNLAAGIFAPLYTGGAIEAEIESATAVQNQAIASYAQKALEALKEVETSLAAEDHLLSREQYMKVVVSENFQAYQLTKKQFDVGKIDFLDVLNVQNKWIQSQISLIDISSRRLLNRVGLHLALGGSFENIEN